MKKVLVFGMTDNPGGVESFLMNYYRKLNRGKIQFDFLCNNKTVAYEDEIASLGGEIFKICARSENPVLYKKQMTAFFKENAKKYCAIWVNVCSLANIDYLKFAKKFGIKTRIIHSHNTQNMDSFLRGLLHKFNRFFIGNYATHFFACTTLAADWFYSEKIKKSPNFKLIFNAIDCEKFAFNERKREECRKELNVSDKCVFGNVGRFHSQKNQSFLLDVFKEISQKREDAVLILCGGGNDETMLRRKTSELKLEDKVLFVGVRNDVERLFQAMDVFLLPSLYEGLGIVLIEAQAAGLPCLASADVIPEDAKVTNLLKFISLESGAENWANEAVEALKNTDRPQTLSLIAAKGYDINTQIAGLENFFETEAI